MRNVRVTSGPSVRTHNKWKSVTNVPETLKLKHLRLIECLFYTFHNTYVQ